MTFTITRRHIMVTLVIVLVGIAAFVGGRTSASHTVPRSRPSPSGIGRAGARAERLVTAFTAPRNTSAGTTRTGTKVLALPKVNPSMVNYPPDYKPRKFLLSVDGSAYMSGITWQSWTSIIATGQGTLATRTCPTSTTPEQQCPFTFSQAVITLWAPRTIDRVLLFGLVSVVPQIGRAWAVELPTQL